MFLSNNDNNIFYAYHKISKIKSVYRYPDKGQVSILLTLARTALGLSLVFEFLFDSMICAIESNHEPRPEILIGIIKLLHKNPKQTNRFSI